MTEREQMIQGLSDAGCSKEAGKVICCLYESGRYQEMLHQRKKERCERLEEKHESQRKVDRMDYLIRMQEKRMK